MGITDLTMTSERESGVDFTIPFMNLGKYLLSVLTCDMSFSIVFVLRQA